MPQPALRATVSVISAGILLYRRLPTGAEVLQVHPGGPYWARKDESAWSIPKGLVGPGEGEFACARREFGEETGLVAPGSGLDLGVFRQPSGKRLHVWAVEGDCEPKKLKSNSFEMMWPPKSGRTQKFPEADRADWFSYTNALAKIVKGQRPIIEQFYLRLIGTQVSDRSSAHRPKG